MTTAQHPQDRTPETTRVEPLVTVEEAAAFLGVQVGTVYLWAECERIPSYKIGNLRRFRLSELEAYVRGQRAGPPEQTPRWTAPLDHVTSRWHDARTEVMKGRNAWAR